MNNYMILSILLLLSWKVRSNSISQEKKAVTDKEKRNNISSTEQLDILYFDDDADEEAVGEVDLRQFLDPKNADKSNKHDHSASDNKARGEKSHYHNDLEREDDKDHESQGRIYHDKSSHDDQASIDRIADALAEVALADSSPSPAGSSDDLSSQDRRSDQKSRGEVVHDQLSRGQKEILQQLEEADPEESSSNGTRNGLWYYYRDRCLNVYSVAVSVVGIGIGVAVFVGLVLCFLWKKNRSRMQKMNKGGVANENVPEDPNELKTK